MYADFFTVMFLERWVLEEVFYNLYEQFSLSQHRMSLQSVRQNPSNRPWRPIVSEMMRIQLYLDNRLTDGGKVVSLTHRQRSTPQKHYYFYLSGTHFC
jgi:hypothetical protein